MTLLNKTPFTIIARSFYVLLFFFNILIYNNINNCLSSPTKTVINYDPGLRNTAMFKSSLTKIDGENGQLYYMGTPIEKICTIKNISFIDVALSMIQRKPIKENISPCIINNKKIFLYKTISESDKNLIKYISNLPQTTTPMEILQATISVLPSFYPENQSNINSHIQNNNSLVNTAILYLVKMPIIVATIYKIQKKRNINEITPLQDSQSYEESIYQLMFSRSINKLSEEEYKKRIDILAKLLIIHADHGQNLSTTTARVIFSGNASMAASLSGAVGALAGSAHGGANQAALEMLENIKNNNTDINNFLNDVKNKKIKLMGFGHRVYKSMDPRAKILKQLCEGFLAKDDLFKLGKEIESAALNHEYFSSRSLYPNVDFYSGLIYKKLGIPKNMFTVMFALGRIAGWMAHIVEQAQCYKSPIIRPRQIYVNKFENTQTAPCEAKVSVNVSDLNPLEIVNLLT